MSSNRYWGRERPDMPVYGPTDPFGDEEHTPDVIVRVDFLMSREQLTTALGIAWAEIAGDRNPESLTVPEARHEVEGWLSVQAFHALDVQMEQDRLRTWPAEQQRVMQLLAGIVERAYPDQPVPSPPDTAEFAAEFPHVAAHLARERGEAPAVQDPRYGEGVVILATLDRGEVTVDEPAWCRGHQGQLVGPLAEVTHEGPDLVADVDGLPLLRANLTHAPFLTDTPEPYPVVYVEGMEAASFDAAGLRALVDVGRSYLDQLEALAARLAEFEGGAGHDL